MTAETKTAKPAKTAKTEVTKPEREETVKITKLDHRKVQKGHLMAFVYYGTITDVGLHGNRLAVNGIDGSVGGFHVEGVELIANSFSADLFASEEKVSKTRAAEILATAYNRPFTVCFDKLDGQERILRGRLVEPEPLLGRSHVEDLDIKEGHKLRLVDHRTLKWLITGNVKYTVR